MAEDRRTRRQQAVLELVTRAGQMTIPELARQLDVSAETVRRDLTALERQGFLIRRRGGAMTLPRLTAGADLRQEAQRYWRLSAAAVTLINPGDVVALDASPFAVAVAARLRHMAPAGITVVTSSLPAANELAEVPDVRLVVTGGMYRGPLGALEGTLAMRALEAYRIQKAFLTSAGFTLRDGPTETDDQQAQLKMALIRNANQVILGVHPESLGTNALIPLCPLSALTWIVLEEPLPPADMEALQSLGIKVVVDPFAARKRPLPPESPRRGMDAGDLPR
ncbi:MAG: DeoR/GlpR family DNA-binding transcription regulator [Firmicutes bacterium]|nr:DeoR/GlpR family DNA-binding transcription regulator [Bacillota bacterium]